MSEVRPIVAVGFCRGSMVHGDFMQSLIMMLMRSISMGIEAGPMSSVGSVICAGRNYLVDEFLKTQCTHLLMLDTDMTFPPDALERLLSHNLPMVAATYCMRMQPRTLVHRDLDDCSDLPVMGEKPNDVYEIASTGMGCVLMHREVLQRTRLCEGQRPLFEFAYTGYTSHIGEDVGFCRKVRNAGFSIHCDIRLSYMLRHVGLYEYSIDDAQAVRRGSSMVFSDHVIGDSEVVPNVPSKQPWTAYSYGGGAGIPLGVLTDLEAAAEVGRTHGTVKHIDREHGFIFFATREFYKGDK